MEIIALLFMIGYVGFFIVSILLFFFFLFKRLNEKGKEEFDHRNN